MQSALLTQEYHYDGSQLRTGWVAEVSGLAGEAIVAFLGGCDVSFEHMLDTEDLQLGHGIRARQMLHVIVEHPGITLDLATARQRLLAALTREVLAEQFGVTGLSRSGDDLYVACPDGLRKLSISVAAVSATSGLIHFALNVDDEGAPVPTIGLSALGLAPVAVARAVLDAYCREIDSCRRAAAKVRDAR